MQEEEDKADGNVNKDDPGDDSEDGGPPHDLFRAIFKNSDSESSSSSDKSDDDKSDGEDDDVDAEKTEAGERNEERSSPTVTMPPESQMLQGKGV